MGFFIAPLDNQTIPTNGKRHGVKKDFLENVRGPGSDDSVPSVSRFTSTVRSIRSVALFIRTSNFHFTTQNEPSGFPKDGEVFFWPLDFTIEFNIHDLVSRSFNHFGFRVSLSPTLLQDRFFHTIR